MKRYFKLIGSHCGRLAGNVSSTYVLRMVALLSRLLSTRLASSRRTETTISASVSVFTKGLAGNTTFANHLSLAEVLKLLALVADQRVCPVGRENIHTAAAAGTRPVISMSGECGEILEPGPGFTTDTSHPRFVSA